MKLAALLLLSTLAGTLGLQPPSGQNTSFPAPGSPPALRAAGCPENVEVDTSTFPPNLFTEKQLAAGYVVLPCIGILYMFLALALVCDNYFVPSLDVLIEELGLTPDVAGATFMAAGGSAPELFTSIIGVFLTKSDVGVGTIVGSAVFNVLFVIAACAFASAKVLSLTAWPLMRDTFFYSVALMLLVGFFSDETIMWWEALILILWYIAYVSFMKFNTAAEGIVTGWLPFLGRPAGAGEEARPDMPGGIKGMRGRGPRLLAQMGDKMGAAGGAVERGGAGLRGLREMLEVPGPAPEEAPGPEGEEEEPWQSPVLAGLKGGPASKLLCVLTLPLSFAMFCTVPDTQRPGWRAFYPLSFIMSLVWITAFSYCMVWWATMVCVVTGISQATMGITFLAAGTSVPDLITSVIVAKAGHGDMAVSSSIGSNLFDVTVGLPLPWLAYCLFYLEPSISVSSYGMVCNIGMLFLMLVAVILSIVLFKWQMTKPMGAVMMLLYATFLGVALSVAECKLSCDFI
jgi:K+-dependent Na+/Ca+ exchanger-like protein